MSDSLVVVPEPILVSVEHPKTPFVTAKTQATLVTQSAPAADVARVVPQAVVVAAGQAGPAGRDGTGDKTYRHVQAIPSASWNVTHSLAKFPSVTVVDSGASVVIGDVVYLDINSCRLTFTGAFSGEAYFN